MNTTTVSADDGRPTDSEAAAYESLLDELRANVSEVTVEQTRRLLEDGEVDLLLDVRETVEWGEKRIAGAVHVPLGLVEWRFNPTAVRADHLLEVDLDAHIVVYCVAGFRSLLAGEFLKSMGYRNVFSMSGGLTEWTALGLPAEASA
jgi:rhodanese-related sulfurtransferase